MDHFLTFPPTHMKTLLLTLLVSVSVASAQFTTASNFMASDCAGAKHDLFSELDGGKVVVLCWVMPCGACTGGATTCYNVVKSFQQKYPDRVVLYVVDDYANTACSSLSSWNSATIPTSTYSARFSSAEIKMSDYGTPGMPKAVVISGPEHTVYYNANNTVNGTAMQAAINQGISAISEVSDAQDWISGVKLVPNPASNEARLSFSLKRSTQGSVEILSSFGETIGEATMHELTLGQQTIVIATDHLANGIYFIRLRTGSFDTTQKILVSR